MAGYVPESLWKNYIFKKFPELIKDSRVLEIGAGIASNKGLFSDAGCKEYIGLDVVEYAGVDIICPAHLYIEPNKSFDVVCSFSALEHDIYWIDTLKKMYNLTKNGGFIFFACCANWYEHGTVKTDAECSLNASLDDERWKNHYRNLLPEDITSVWNLNNLFHEYKLEIDPLTTIDLHFWGIKR